MKSYMKSFQVISSKKMENEVIFFADDEYRVYCDICDKLCIQRFYKNHIKPQTQKKFTADDNQINHFK